MTIISPRLGTLVNQVNLSDLVEAWEFGIRALTSVARRMSRLGTETAFDVLRRAEELKAAGRPVINLGIGAPDFRTPDNIVEAGRQALSDGWHKYTPAKGIVELRETIAWDIERRHNAPVDPGSVMVVPGGKPTMFFAMLMFGEPGVEIMYPDPGFPIYRSMIEFSGATPVPIRLDESNEFSFDPDQVIDSLSDRTRLVILNSPSNPTGGVYGQSDVDALVAGLERLPGAYVMSDEIYSRLVFGGRDHISLIGYEGLRDRLILLDGCSKTWAMTGWRLGWGVWPTNLIERAVRLQINSNSCATAAVQVAAIEAIRGPQEEAEAMAAEFEARAMQTADALDAIDGISCLRPGGAFYVFPYIEGTGLTSEQMEDRLLEEVDVAVVAGTSFGERGRGHIRISCAASSDDLAEAVARIEGFVDRLL